MNTPEQNELIHKLVGETHAVLQRVAALTGSSIDQVLDAITAGTGAPGESPEVATFKAQQNRNQQP